MAVNKSLSVVNKRSFFLLVLLCVVLLMLFLGATPFNTRGEPREAVVAMSMLADGNWILPVNNGDEIAFKPPLLHWCVAALSWAAGGISEVTSRMPSALAATAMVLATYVFFVRRRDEETGMLAALITLTNFEVFRAAATCRVDMLLASLMVLGIFSLTSWGERGMKGLPWTGFLCLAGAALVKGPVGIVLPCGAVALYLLLRGGVRLWPIVWKFALIAIVSLLPLLAWYAAAYAQPHGGERFLQLIYEENILRFTGNMTYASHVNPWYYNVQTVLTGMLPYTLLLLCALPVGVKWLRNQRFPLGKTGLGSWHPVEKIRQMNAADLVAIVAFGVIFVFYCIPASKRSVYLLPLYPFAAYGIARFILWLCASHVGVVRAFSAVLSVLAFVVSVVFIGVKGGVVPDSLFQGRHAAENVAFLHALRDMPLGVVEVLLYALPVFFAVLCLRRSSGIRPSVMVGLVFSLLLSVRGLYLPPIMNVKTDKPIADRIAGIVPEGQLYSYRTDVLEANRMHPFTINFYLGDRIIPIDKAAEQPVSGYVVMGDDASEVFLKAYPQYVLRQVFDTHHRSCDDYKVVKFYEFRMK